MCLISEGERVQEISPPTEFYVKKPLRKLLLEEPKRWEVTCDVAVEEIGCNG